MGLTHRNEHLARTIVIVVVLIGAVCLGAFGPEHIREYATGAAAVLTPALFDALRVARRPEAL